MKFTNRIKQYREKMGLTQEELANLVGIANRHHMSKIESGLFRPNTKNMVRIAEVLKAPVSDIFLV